MTQPEAPAPNSQARPPPGAWRRAYAALVSPKLAIALLLAVLACCLVGVTAFSYERAWELIFSALWFNGLLVLLAVSAGAAFFTRIWRRKLTLVSVGMILFHLSFMALLAGVVYNGLFRFRGTLRLTEGETLPNAQPETYDQFEHGRFFSFGSLRGETTLVKMHRDYQVGGENKRAAYEIQVSEGERRAEHVIYPTEYFDDGGVRYFCSKEGYSVLVVLHDAKGAELYGGHVPLQSIRQGDGSRLYSTGSATEPEAFPFPAPPEQAAFELQVNYWPSTEDRRGQVGFRLLPLPPAGAKAGGEQKAPAGVAAARAPAEKPPADHPSVPAAGGPAASGEAGAERNGLVAVGGVFDAGDYRLEAREIRYWVSMDVRYDPGLNVSLGSLVTGLAGMFLTLAGRLRQGARKKVA